MTVVWSRLMKVFGFAQYRHFTFWRILKRFWRTGEAPSPISDLEWAIVSLCLTNGCCRHSLKMTLFGKAKIFKADGNHDLSVCLQAVRVWHTLLRYLNALNVLGLYFAWALSLVFLIVNL